MVTNLQSKDTDFGRYYRSPTTGLWYPSVTTVTGHSKNAFFAEWRKKPGNEEMMRKAAKRGTDLHKIIEDYLKEEKIPSKQNIFHYSLFNQILPYLNKIEKIEMQEVALWSDTLKLAGRVDCVGVYEGQLSIIDFKGSSKEKREEYIQNYFEQTTCYAIMYSEMFKMKVKQIVILIASEDGKTQEFIRKPIDYVKQTRNTISNYWKEVDFDQLQEKIGALDGSSIQVRSNKV